ncbi:XisH family protein [Cyanobacteria bacterium FACHB-DQ100]|uniref:XisH family protein n=1 Tax=Leptolyngbya sp. DQ-M1 TaxID=2933920 RepID=UPI0019A40DD1|nr:XisH family protein [Cyanobacteria bacterium FACHB-DQ100]
MPAKDLYHDAMKNALSKDGWIITKDPLTIEYEEIQVYADMAATKLFAAERDARKIAVEVKSFISPSPVRDLELALGQYIIYRSFLTLTDPDRQVYLAIREEVFNSFFQLKAIQTIIEQNQIFLIVIDTTNEVIVQWTN